MNFCKNTSQKHCISEGCSTEHQILWGEVGEKQNLLKAIRLIGRNVGAGTGTGGWVYIQWLDPKFVTAALCDFF